MDTMLPNELRLASGPLVGEGVFITIQHALQHANHRVDGGSDVCVVGFESRDLANPCAGHFEKEGCLMMLEAADG